MFDDLFAGPPTTRGWLGQVSPECRAAVDNLVDLVVKHGREPSWAATHQRFKELFPSEVPTSKSTIPATVRRLVEERRGG